MKEFPRDVQHVLLLSAIPMLYPGLGVVESLLNAFNKAPAKMLFKTGSKPYLSSSIALCMLKARHKCSLVGALAMCLMVSKGLMYSQAYISR